MRKQKNAELIIHQMKTNKEIISSYGDVIRYRKKNIWKLTSGDSSIVSEFHGHAGIVKTIKIAMNTMVTMVEEAKRGI